MIYHYNKWFGLVGNKIRNVELLHVEDGHIEKVINFCVSDKFYHIIQMPTGKNSVSQKILN